MNVSETEIDESPLVRRFLKSRGLAAFQLPIVVPMIVLAALTVSLRMTNIEIRIAALYYDFSNNVWPHCDAPFWNSLDHIAVTGGWVVMIGTMIASVRYWKCAENPWARRLIILFLAVGTLGPGLLVNGILKPTFGRPRPREVVELGGQLPYAPVLEIGASMSSNASFPSGHASFAFLLIVPAFALHRRKRIAAVILSGGFVWGAFVGFSRIIQGGHFLGDVVYSAAVIYGTAWAFDAYLRRYPSWIGTVARESAHEKTAPFEEQSRREVPQAA